jgi:ribonuclease HII|uniref:Ribonuclease HII n=1 Tax=viral metagenome TaxID=1070528 RepID=A0A6C0CB86_9ZZZZ
MSKVIKSCLLKKYHNNNTLFEIGIDEVGRGPMFGRVYSAAVILPINDTFKYECLKDSKKFSSQKKISEVADYIKANALFWAICYEDEKAIDSLNIRNATIKAMHNAISAIIVKYNETANCVNFNDLNEQFYLLIDGNDFKCYTYFCKKSNVIKQLNNVLVEGGDNKYCSIAAASILAKVERDNYIRSMCLEFPKLDTYYGLLNNKGYGTIKHMEGIKKYGISKWHRNTYGCCKDSTVNEDEFYI